MDRSNQLSRCCCCGLVGWVAVASLLIVGCGVRLEDESPPHSQVSVAPIVGLDDGIEMLGAPDAEILSHGINLSHRTTEALAALPSHAISAGFFGVGEHDDPPRRPSELVVANYWPTPLRMNVVCLVDGAQVSYSQDTTVWRVELDEPGLAIVDLPESDARRDVVLVEERDQMVQRVYPVSHVRPIDGWDVGFSTLSDPPPTVTNPFGGCDWALLLDNLSPQETFKPLRAKGAGAVHLVISICPETAGHEMRPLILLDDSTVAHIDTFLPFIAQPGTTYALQIPDEVFEAARTIRGAVVRRAPASSRWTTHPLHTAA